MSPSGLLLGASGHLFGPNRLRFDTYHVLVESHWVLVDS